MTNPVTIRDVIAGRATTEQWTATTKPPEVKQHEPAKEAERTEGKAEAATPPSETPKLSINEPPSIGLKRRYGLGSRPELRAAFFARLDALAVLHPDLMRQVIAEANMLAHAARHPDRYFCSCVQRKLAHHSLDLIGV